MHAAGPDVPTARLAINGPCPPIHKSVSYGFWSWEFSSHTCCRRTSTAYARIGRSQRSGGWNAPLATIQDQPFRPEQLTDFELGIKADLLDGALGINGDVFYGRYDDMQRLLATLTPTGTPTTEVINAGRARVSGAELETVWRLSPHTWVRVTGGWTDARYVSFTYQPSPFLPAENLAGNSFYQTPRYQASVGASYGLPTPAGDLRLFADYAWQDQIQFNVINDFNYQKAYGTLNARLVLSDPATRWQVALFSNNLTNEHYAYTGGTVTAPGSPTPTIAWNVPGTPRMYGIEATLRWSQKR